MINKNMHKQVEMYHTNAECNLNNTLHCTTPVLFNMRPNFKWHAQVEVKDTGLLTYKSLDYLHLNHWPTYI